MKRSTSLRAYRAKCAFTSTLILSFAILTGCDDATGTGGAGGASSNTSTSTSSTTGSTSASTTGSTSVSTTSASGSTSTGGMTSSSSGTQFCAYGNSDCKGCEYAYCLQPYNTCIQTGTCSLPLQTYETCVCDHQNQGDAAGIHDDCAVPFEQSGGMLATPYVVCMENACSVDAKCDLD